VETRDSPVSNIHRIKEAKRHSPTMRTTTPATARGADGSMRRGVRAPQHTCGRRVGVAGEEAVEDRVEMRLHRIRDLRAHADAPQGA